MEIKDTIYVCEKHAITKVLINNTLLVCLECVYEAGEEWKEIEKTLPPIKFSVEKII